MSRFRGNLILMAGALGLGLLLVGCDWFTGHKKTVPPPDPYPVLDSEKALVETLEIAYHKFDLEKFQSLFPPLESANYLFLLSEPTNNETSWGASEEMRIHRRMFRPQLAVPPETPVPGELWLQSVDISLTPQTEFVERPDLYRSVSNPDGLDPATWRATEATYTTYVFFQLAGSTDYQVNGRANFVVIENRTLPGAAEPGKWFLYRWEDLNAGSLVAAGARDVRPSLGVKGTSWGGVKRIYR